MTATACNGGSEPIVVGAIYPTAGGEGMGGVEELRGVQLAAELANSRGGVGGRPIQIEVAPTDSAEGAPAAMERLTDAGATVVVGSYGSTISRVAADAATREDVVFWETGAVGQFDPGTATGERVFRFAPSGESLGRAATTFVKDQLLPELDRRETLRWSVAYVDDAYGRSVGLGAIDEVRRSGLQLAGNFPYDLSRTDYDRLARRIADADTDVLVVAAYLEDGIALRRAILEARVPLVANIGTSSSYCHPEFGSILGEDAVGLFASDKPDADVLDPTSLRPEAARVLRWGRTQYEKRFRSAMSAAALSGFSGGWALFRNVLPAARDLSAPAVAEAIRATRLPAGSLPDGAGLAFAQNGEPSSGSNLEAVSVIWEWVKPGVRQIVWPPAFATSRIVPIPLS